MRADVAMTGEITLRGEVLPHWWFERKRTVAHQTIAVLKLVIISKRERT